MSISQPVPDYELDDVRIVTSTQELKAMFDAFRGTLLELLLERAASVQELASAVKRPKSTVAYHVDLLSDAGMLKVVRTRTIRAGRNASTGEPHGSSTSARSRPNRPS